MLAIFSALVPFPYGAVTPAGTAVLCGGAFLIGMLAFLTRPASRRIGSALLPIIALVLLACLGGVQLIPLSIDRLKEAAPLSAQTWSDANEILGLYGRAPAAPRISIAPFDTKVTILLTLAYIVLFASAAVLLSNRKRRRVAITMLLASAALQALYAAATTSPTQRVHGTFINPNHFAGYLEIALAVSFGVLWNEILHNRDRAARIRDVADRLEKRALPLIGPVLLWSVMAAGIVLTRSRGGILAATATTVMLIAILVANRRRESRVAAVATPAIIAVVAGLTFIVLTAGNIPLLRFLSSDPREIGSNARLEIWQASVRAWEQSPLAGCGLGAFREAFRRVQPATVNGLVEQAHNDFLQMLVTGGWIGAALVTIAFASMLILLIRGWLRQEHREESAIVLAGIGALISLLLHGLVEFNMSIPGIPATLAIVLGLAWAAANDHDAHHQMSHR